MFGEIVPELSHSFDVFWNSELAVPMEAYGTPAKKEGLEKWQQHMEAVVSGEHPSAYASAINSPVLAHIQDGELKPYVASADFVYDVPGKLLASRRSREYRALATELRNRMEAASSEIIVITPYFVPRVEGIEWIEEICGRGIRLVVITNSLASTNHVAVHSGYARYRRRVLAAGAELYEVKVDEIPRAMQKPTALESVTLHTKAVVIDRDELFVGSLNFDPRSIAINTEVGLFIHSPEMASDFAQLVWEDIPKYTYRVELNERGKLRWHYEYNDADLTYTSEPQAGAWRRFKAGFYRLLPIEDQL